MRRPCLWYHHTSFRYSSSFSSNLPWYTWNRTRGCSFLLSTTLTERRTKFCKKRIFPNGYFQTEMSVLEVWPAGLCERVPSSCNTWYFLLSPPKQDKTGEREKRVCVTAAGFCGCESSHFHTFLDEMRRGKEEAKEKKRKLIGIRFGWKSKTKRNCKKLAGT